jgi:hypothetical protein
MGLRRTNTRELLEELPATRQLGKLQFRLPKDAHHGVVDAAKPVPPLPAQNRCRSHPALMPTSAPRTPSPCRCPHLPLHPYSNVRQHHDYDIIMAASSNEGCRRRGHLRRFLPRTSESSFFLDQKSCREQEIKGAYNFQEIKGKERIPISSQRPALTQKKGSS